MEYVTYANQGATRNQPISPDLAAAMSFLPELGVTMEVFSGGQPGIDEGGARVGSTRHDHGNSADVFFYQNGRRLDWANPQDRPIFEQIAEEAAARGVVGQGAGPGYMQQGSMHIGFGDTAVWGEGGSGANAPQWLRDAHGRGIGRSGSTGTTGRTQGTAQPGNALGQVPVTPQQNALAAPPEPQRPQLNYIANILDPQAFMSKPQNAMQMYGFGPGQSPYLQG